MAIEVFNRYEKKYILDEHTFRRLLERINDYMEPDKYNLKTYVSSYDSSTYVQGSLACMPC